MRLFVRLHTALIMLGAGSLVAVAITMARAASFQESAAHALEHRLSESASVAAPFDGGLIGRLEIPRLNVSVIVMEGDDDSTLARAVGHVPGTALPWDVGNAVIAGHRDTFFRPLKDIQLSDTIRFTTPEGTTEYRVISTKVVSPNDTWVLDENSPDTLTLVTCYPFYYIGPAPKRFIVQAEKN